MRSTFGKTVTELAKKDKKIVVLVGDISHGLFGDLRKIANERYFNIGINEQSMINIAAGLSMQGFNPVVHTIAPFLIDRDAACLLCLKIETSLMASDFFI